MPSRNDGDESDIAAFAGSARSLLAGMGSSARVRALRHTSPGFERDAWRRFAEAGWLAVLVPEAHGGLGLDLRHAAAIAEEVGRALLPEPLVGVLQAIATLCALPAGDLRDRLLERCAAGELIVGVAWHERPGELDPPRPGLQGGASALRGSREWVVPGPGADGWLVLAADADRPALHWMPADTPGLRCERIARIDGSPMGRLVFDTASVAAAQALAVGETALAALAHGNEVARLLQAAELLGVSRRAFETTLDYLKTRQQFGKPIGSNQALQHRMVDALLQLELAAAGLRDALDAAPTDAQALASAASRAKARCTHAALHIGRMAVQFHGAMGYTDECDVGLYLQRALHLSAWLGNAEAHRLRYLRLLCSETPGRLAEAEPARSEFPRQADWAAMDEAEFRSIVRGFFQAHYPPQLRHVSRRLHWAEISGWYLTLARQGWLAPAWPKAHGGMELPPDKLLAFIEEQEDHGIARMPDQGLINLGPVLIAYGTPAQRAQWLPKILAGEHVWCQGYSEPNAGSDLASLRTEAVADGSDFIVSGQKIWTTLAQDATHIFLLVRTDKTVKKQEGISFLLVDLASPGVTVRPIRNIAGEEEFCEVFFDQVRVPQANLVGELNRGWSIAKALLGFERIFVGSPKTPQYALGQLRLAAVARGVFDEPAFRSRYAELQLDLADLRSLYAGFAEIVKRGEALPASVSLLKIWATETYTRIALQLIECSDEHGGSVGPGRLGEIEIEPLAPLMNALVTTIYGGTNEIQRNILARQVLGLTG